MEELLNPDFRTAYIRQKCQALLDTRVTSESIAFMNEGVLNYVYRVKTAKGILFFKQALKKSKARHQIGADMASIAPTRIQTEKKVLNLFRNILPASITVPQVLDYDEENNILVMTDAAGKNAELLQQCFLAGKFNKTTASSIGRFLGLCHKHTYKKGFMVRGDREEDEKNWKLFLNMRTKGISSDSFSRKIVAALTKLYHDAVNHYTFDVLITMDCCPKNIFQKQNGSIGVFDFELASGMGDPAYDVGFLIGHYLIFSALNNTPVASKIAIESLMDSYIAEIQSLPFYDDLIIRRIIKYSGAIMFYRVIGASPAGYIPQNRYQELIEKGTVLLLNEADR